LFLHERALLSRPNAPIARSCTSLHVSHSAGARRVALSEVRAAVYFPMRAPSSFPRRRAPKFTVSRATPGVRAPRCARLAKRKRGGARREGDVMQRARACAGLVRAVRKETARRRDARGDVMLRVFRAVVHRVSRDARRAWARPRCARLAKRKRGGARRVGDVKLRVLRAVIRRVSRDAMRACAWKRNCPLPLPPAHPRSPHGSCGDPPGTETR
jgi:hypothetical protein